MTVLARLETHNETSKERRTAPRVKLRLGTFVGASASSALVHDLSTTGLLFETSAELPGDCVEVQLPHVETAKARIVWRHGRFIGCEFTDPIPGASVSAALLRSEYPVHPHGNRLGVPAVDYAPWPDRRRRRLAGWLKGFVVLAALAAGAAYLVATGKITLLVVMGAILAVLATVLTVVAWWSLDNTVQL